MKRKQMWILGGGLTVILIVGLSIAATQDQGLAVQVATVGQENLQSKVSANGKIQAVTKADISANVMGQVTRLAVKEGDRVSKGQFLMEIDPRSASANADAMKASLQAALSDLASASANLRAASTLLALLRTRRGTQSIVRSSSSIAPRIRGTQYVSNLTPRVRSNASMASINPKTPAEIRSFRSTPSGSFDQTRSAL